MHSENVGKLPFINRPPRFCLWRDQQICWIQRRGDKTGDANALDGKKLLFEADDD